MAISIRLWLLGGLAGFVGMATPVNAAPDAQTLYDVMRLDEVIAVMRDEGLAYGVEMDRDMLDGQGGVFWTRQVARIYEPARMADLVLVALNKGLSDAQTADCVAFFDTKLGQRILSLETSARVAMADAEVEQFARDTYASLKGSDDPRLATVTRFVTMNDLLERNVSGSMTASYAFLRGLVDGGASKLSDSEISADVWSQEAETRADTESWLYGFLLMAYQPLSDADLDAYLAFSATPSGQALNAALFDGFDAGYRDISHALGLLIAEAASYSEL